MGYDVHITRANSWLDAEEHPITLEAWLEYARSDPEMRVDGWAEAQTSQGEHVAVDSPGLTVWTAYSRDGENGNHAWFDLQRGCVVVKNPDIEILRKMWRVAAHFDARVQGDEGENYGADGHPVEDRPERRWWQRLLGR